MGDVHQLVVKQPHIRLSTPDGNQHVIPVSLVRDMINGKASLDLFDEQVWRGILSSFLWSLENENG